MLVDLITAAEAPRRPPRAAPPSRHVGGPGLGHSEAAAAGVHPG
jgi:hypothetical protein